MNGETNLNALIRTMKPRLNDGDYVFCSLETVSIDLSDVLFLFKEKEGITLVCTEKIAKSRHYAYNLVFSWITLDVHSALEAVGLTAAFSQALAVNNISCNVVAGYYHDHIFVPKELGTKALKVLENLAKNGKNTEGSPI